jgi:hypothetical protein
MAIFKVVLERTDTITKQGIIMVEAATGDEARQQIAKDLEVDPRAYDYDLEPVEDGVGDITIKMENEGEERMQFPRPVARRAY